MATASSWIIILSLISGLIFQISQATAALQVSEDDEIFYRNVELEIRREVNEAGANLAKQAKVVQEATKNYATAKVKQDFFKALRVLAEQELLRVSMQDRLRQPRQDDNEEEVEGAGEEAEGTTQRTVPLIPVVANVLKAVFGGNNETMRPGVNLTYISQSVSQGIRNRITGLTNLLTDPFGRRRTTQAPVRIIQLVPIPVAAGTNASNITAALDPANLDPVLAKLLKKDLDYSSGGAKRLQEVPAVDYHHPAPTKPAPAPKATTVPPVAVAAATTNATMTRPEGGVIYIDSLTKDVQQGLDGLIKAVPDLFVGAREAVKLITTVQNILDELDIDLPI